MTTKQLSEFFGKTKQTIINHAEKCNIILEHGKEKIYTKDEVELISKSIYKTVPKAIRESIDLTYNSIKIDSKTDTKIDRLENLVEKYYKGKK
jgi:hypothetical protein